MRYYVTEYQPGVSFTGQPRSFRTLAEARAYARKERNASMRRGWRKECIDLSAPGDTAREQFRAVHPFYGVQYAATVRDSERRRQPAGA